MVDGVKKLTPFTDGSPRKVFMGKITAVALTGAGANPEANVTFFKSKDKDKAEALAKFGGDLVDLLTSANDDHQHGIEVRRDSDGVRMVVHYATSGTGEEYSHDHMVIMDADGTFTMSENHGHTHELDQSRLTEILLRTLVKAGLITEEGDLASLLKASDGKLPVGLSGNIVFGKTEELPMTEAEKVAHKAATDALEAKLAKANSIGAMTDAAKAHYTSLSGDEADAFLAKTADEQAAIVSDLAKASTDADPVVFKSASGEEFRKSDDPRLVTMAKERDADRKDTSP